jgi:hypothetical protein
LDLTVGLLASAVEQADDESVTNVKKGFAELNAVLRDAGLPPHCEPSNLAGQSAFEAQMWGYGGLHNVRRLAAHFAYERELAPPRGYVVEANTTDPHLARFYEEHTRAAFGRPGLLDRILGRGSDMPPFEHLIMHSDCEGFYLPRRLERVVIDRESSQRQGVGGFVGSYVQLLDECKILAQLIDLPTNIDPEAEELWEAAETPAAEGPLWQQYGIEAFCLSRLIRGCELSIETGAALVFN